MNTELHEQLEEPEYELDYTSLGIFVSLILVVGVVFWSLMQGSPSAEPIQFVEEENTVAVLPEEAKEDPYEGLEIEGLAAYVWDSSKGEVLFAKNEETQLPLASITKLMTIAATADFIDTDETLVVESDSLYEDGDSGLLANEEWNAKDLIDFTLLVSSNDGADVLANAAGAAKLVRGSSKSESPEAAFLEEMNDIATEIGLTQTFFLNETGLDPTMAVSGGYGSARDTALLMEYVIKEHPDLVSATAYETKEIESESKFIHSATNTNTITGNIPGLIASKTGFTDLAGGNLVIAFDAGINRPIIVAVLGSSLEGRFTDVEALVNASLAYISQ